MSQQEPINVKEPVDPAVVKAEDVQGKSQGQLVRRRFFGKNGAVISLIVLTFVV